MSAKKREMTNMERFGVSWFLGLIVTWVALLINPINPGNRIVDILASVFIALILALPIFAMLSLLDHLKE